MCVSLHFSPVRACGCCPLTQICVKAVRLTTETRLGYELKDRAGESFIQHYITIVISMYLFTNHNHSHLSSFAEISTKSHIWRTMQHGLWMAAWHGLWLFLYKKLGWGSYNINAAVVILTYALFVSFELACESVCLSACMFVLGWPLIQSLVHLQPTRSSSESICSRPGSSIPGSPGHTIYVSRPCQRHLSLPEPITIHSQMESVVAWGCTECSFSLLLSLISL